MSMTTLEWTLDLGVRVLHLATIVGFMVWNATMRHIRELASLERANRANSKGLERIRRLLDEQEMRLLVEQELPPVRDGRYR